MGRGSKSVSRRESRGNSITFVSRGTVASKVRNCSALCLCVCVGEDREVRLCIYGLSRRRFNCPALYKLSQVLAGPETINGVSAQSRGLPADVGLCLSLPLCKGPVALFNNA